MTDTCPTCKQAWPQIPPGPLGLSPTDVISEIERVGGKVFKGPYNVTLFGIRNDDTQSDMWDDWIGALYQNDDDEWEMDIYPATTDPGTVWLERGNSSRGGTAVMCEHIQFKGCWELGMHRGSYPALVQRGGKVAVYRDGNLDDQVDAEGDQNWGYFGINCHRASAHRLVSRVGLYSAGCQVVRDPAHFAAYLDLCRKSVESGYGEKFSYILLKWPFEAGE